MGDLIRHKRSADPGAVPSAEQLTVGELAINTADGLVFTKLATGEVIELSSRVIQVAELLTVPGAGTWVRPAAMVGTQILLTGIGGGASGNRASTTSQQNGGDGGQYVIDYPVDIGSDESVDYYIGNAGGVTTSTTGNAGEPTTFGEFVTLLGGGVVTATTRPDPLGAPGARYGTLPGGDTPTGFGGRLGGAWNGAAPGGGGLVLDDSGVNAATHASSSPATGYGAGGGAGSSGNNNGVHGALLLKYWVKV